jgi:hypothetical protein
MYLDKLDFKELLNLHLNLDRRFVLYIFFDSLNI